jgi:hypothetical protein
MSRSRKPRTPTTNYEHGILTEQIHRFFAAPARSPSRALVVDQVLELLIVDNREWTARTVRLWFNNNRSHYLNDRLQAEPLPAIPLAPRPPPPPPPLPGRAHAKTQLPPVSLLLSADHPPLPPPPAPAPAPTPPHDEDAPPALSLGCDPRVRPPPK